MNISDTQFACWISDRVVINIPAAEFHCFQAESTCKSSVMVGALVHCASRPLKPRGIRMNLVRLSWELLKICCRMWKRWSRGERPMTVVVLNSSRRFVFLVQKSQQRRQVNQTLMSLGQHICTRYCSSKLVEVQTFYPDDGLFFWYNFHETGLLSQSELRPCIHALVNHPPNLLWLYICNNLMSCKLKMFQRWSATSLKHLQCAGNHSRTHVMDCPVKWEWRLVSTFGHNMQLVMLHRHLVK